MCWQLAVAPHVGNEPAERGRRCSQQCNVHVPPYSLLTADIAAARSQRRPVAPRRRHPARSVRAQLTPPAGRQTTLSSLATRRRRRCPPLSQPWARTPPAVHSRTSHLVRSCTAELMSHCKCAMRRKLEHHVGTGVLQVHGSISLQAVATQVLDEWGTACRQRCNHMAPPALAL
jgi:hypothetical protein